MSQSINLANITNVIFDWEPVYRINLNGVRIWERYTAQRQVWVSSGYNTSSWVRIQTRNGYRGTANNGYGAYWWNSDKNFTGFYSDTAYGGPAVSRHRNNTNDYNQVWTIGNYRYSKGGYDPSASPKTTRYHGLNIDQYQTSWVDTSSYQTESYTAYYYY